ncbi:DNA topoisomerase III [Aciduricibacillus chroicocephali]|uniref:DNA topoisomerase 3 n=1 Tax=Aciduricibacillus chroicocephali TaxID=3054939 RepID=A0ABY9KU53_9BACI|nr:DNA topoisomerase III [Bacillaceae bacterium 44XB]
MMKTVVLAEKPSVGRDLARVLQCTKKGNGYLEGSKYIVTWALGHLVELAQPENYDVKYQTWNLEDLPMLPDNLCTVVMKKTGKQFQAVKSQLVRQDVGEIVIATDAGREGELVARWIIEKARVNKPVKRLWISSVTDKAIQDGFKNLKPGKAYENLYYSAIARAEADWFVGLNATRALTTKFNAQLSGGRVQTPTLAMIRQREEEIKSFQPRTYYGIEASTKNGLKLRWSGAKGNSRIFDKAKADKLLAGMKGEELEIKDVEKKQKKKHAPQLYDLTELQRDANRLFGFSGKETLRTMQRLYEQHKLLTYPRTDSRVITTDLVPTLPERLKACATSDYAPFAKKLMNKKFNLPKSVVNDAAVSDHHAIIPTEETAYLENLDASERKIYDLVTKRFLAVLSDPHEYEEVQVKGKIGQDTFTAKGTIVTKEGWKEIYARSSYKADDEERAGRLPDVKKGESFPSPDLKQTSGETEPPARFTEGTLLSAMENPVRYMQGEDKHLQQTMTKAGGLGTVATRADIIEKLYNTGYMELKGKNIYLTSKGRQLLDLVPEDLKSPALTAEWEEKLTDIANGRLKHKEFISGIKEYTKEIVAEIKSEETKFKHDNLTGTKCPDCGKLMLEIKNKNGKMLVCQDRSCGHKKNISRNTNARCPNCHKRMQMRGEGEGQMFFCTCGHREKLSTFQERKKKHQNTRVSKKDMNKYMKKEDSFSNNPFAEALAKLKKD